jgi:hypothetical protein
MAMQAGIEAVSKRLVVSCQRITKRERLREKESEILQYALGCCRSSTIPWRSNHCHSQV